MSTSVVLSNRIIQLFENKKENILNIYFTAGFPHLEDTVPIIKSLAAAGVDLIEIGMPYSDPVADGPIIQESNMVALDNGMTVKKLLDQLKDIRKEVSVPILLMGYINPVLQYGIEAFVRDSSAIGIDGVILPDLPMEEYERHYKKLFEENNLSFIGLITPNTSEKRLATIDRLSTGFIYMVSTNSTTGNESKSTQAVDQYFQRIQASGLVNPRLIGFNIKDHTTFAHACSFAQGAIIGSAFIKMIRQSDNIHRDIPSFVKNIRG
ncbi:MAG: tryptophan synthase subunit alpha [Cytophagaceae bacterium]|jgi:tryptophan synthase alpha chain|nr:tryptophan synthase subunit alpha [Cytophagaceae bacterium]